MRPQPAMGWGRCRACMQPEAGTVRRMVRLIPIERGGKIVWTEDAPDACPAGHEGLLPRWRPCAACGWGCRHWLCAVGECGLLIRDYDHRCRG